MSTQTKTTAASRARKTPIGKQAKPRAPAKPKPTIIKVVGQPEKPYRTDSARDLYWRLIQQYAGQPVATFVAFAKANPPATPKHGKLAGKAEPPMGWVRYFVRTGVLQLTQ